MPSRPADVFFYGLFMDEDLLREKGLNPQRAALASVDGLALRIGKRAALVPTPGGRATASSSRSRSRSSTVSTPSRAFGSTSRTPCSPA